MVDRVRNKVLFGDYSVHFSDWKSPSWKLLVFVSSTFTDTHIERDKLPLMLPELAKRANGYGIDISLSDMRWGIPGKASVDHGTWTACKNELERCRNQSSGIFFISLQSEK